MTNLAPRLPALTLQRVTATLVILIVGFWLLGGLFLFEFFSLYLVFIVVTILVVRSVPVQPGRLLGRRAVRRGLVGTIAAACLFISVSPYGPNGIGAVPLLALILALCLFLLGRATRRVASAPDHRIDERQEALRNRAHRLAYWIFGVVAAATVLVAYVASPDSRAWLGTAVQGTGPFMIFFVLLFFLPAMALAWLEPDRLSGEKATSLASIPRARLAVAMVTAALVIPLLLSVTLALVPVSVTTTVRSEPSQDAAISCTYFDARARVGSGFGAIIPLSAVACWDGRKAFEEWGLNASDCLPNRTEMTTVDVVRCSRTTDADGTLHFVYEARVRSAVLPFVSKDVLLTLALARDGTVLSFP